MVGGAGAAATAAGRTAAGTAAGGRIRPQHYRAFRVIIIREIQPRICLSLHERRIHVIASRTVVPLEFTVRPAVSLRKGHILQGLACPGDLREGGRASERGLFDPYLERLLRYYIVVRIITNDLIPNGVGARVGRGGKAVAVVAAVVQAVLHLTALDVALVDEHLRRAVVNQSGFGRRRGVGRVLLAVIHNRKMRFKPFSVKFKLCQIFTRFLQFILIGNRNRVAGTTVVTPPIFDVILLGFYHVLGPVCGMDQRRLGRCHILGI